MPYKYPDSVPPQIKNKPADQQKAFVEAFNSAIERGQSEDSAFIAGLGALNQVARKHSVKKQSFSAKGDTPQSRPSHIPSPEMLKAMREEAEKPSFQEDVKKAALLPAFLAQHSLPQDKQRNVIAANFDSTGKLVIAFDTGEKIVTNAIAVNEFIEKHISINGNGGGSATAEPGNIVYVEYLLNGATTTIQAATHMLSAITSYYILKQDGSEIILDVVIDQNKNITVSSLIPMTNFKLYLTGIKA